MKKTIVIFFILFLVLYATFLKIDNNTMSYYKEQNRNKIVELIRQNKEGEKELNNILRSYKKVQDELEEYKQYNQIQKERINLIEKQYCYAQWKMQCNEQLETIKELWDRINKDTEECAAISGALETCKQEVLNFYNPNY